MSGAIVAGISAASLRDSTVGVPPLTTSRTLAMVAGNSDVAERLATRVTMWSIATQAQGADLAGSRRDFARKQPAGSTSASFNQSKVSLASENGEVDAAEPDEAIPCNCCPDQVQATVQSDRTRGVRNRDRLDRRQDPRGHRDVGDPRQPSLPGHAQHALPHPTSARHSEHATAPRQGLIPGLDNVGCVLRNVLAARPSNAHMRRVTLQPHIP